LLRLASVSSRAENRKKNDPTATHYGSGGPAPSYYPVKLRQSPPHHSRQLPLVKVLQFEGYFWIQGVLPVPSDSPFLGDSEIRRKTIFSLHKNIFRPNFFACLALEQNKKILLANGPPHLLCWAHSPMSVHM
jgi:hypothetical protein